MMRITALPLLAAMAVSIPGPLSAQSANGVGSPFELAFWQSVSGSDDPAVYDAYLQQYPTGTFAGLARAKLGTLRKTAQTPSATAPVTAQAPATAAQLLPAVATVAHPAPVPVPAPAPAPTPSPAPVTAPPVASPASAPVHAGAKMAASTTPPPAIADSSQAASDANLLLELARSQEAGGGTGRVAAAQGFALPVRPVLSDIADLPLPSSFCSAEQRNAFYETRYKPYLDLARSNNDAAIAYMQKLQQAYDSYQLSGDPTPMNVLAAEASAYQQQVAATAYARQASVVRQFDQIMALPITTCQIAAAAK